jgi:hypothetical protein
MNISDRKIIELTRKGLSLNAIAKIVGMSRSELVTLLKTNQQLSKLVDRAKRNYEKDFLRRLQKLHKDSLRPDMDRTRK